MEDLVHRFGLLCCCPPSNDSNRSRREPAATTKPVPLKNVVVRPLICNFVHCTLVEQEYVNDATETIETIYRFPLQPNTAVVNFEAQFDGVKVKGIVQERKQAKATFDKAISENKSAALMEQDRPDVFKCVIGNLPAGQSCTVRFVVVGELPLDGNHVRFALPMCVAPKYVAPPVTEAKNEDEDKDTIMATTTSTGTSAAGAAAATTAQQGKAPPRLPSATTPYKLRFEADVRMPKGLGTITSPTHGDQIRVTKADGGAANHCCTVTLAAETSSLNRDLVLMIDRQEPHAPSVLVEYDAVRKSAAVQLTFCPQASPEEEQPNLVGEIVMVPDKSGSMHGDSMSAQQAALHLLVRSLPTECKFNIVGFESEFDALFTKPTGEPESRPYSEETVKAATAYIDRMEASGGTELYPPLEAVLSAPVDPKCPRQVFVLTDGDLDGAGSGGEDKVERLARKYAGTARIFTFGIGSGVSRSLIQSLARAGNGEAEFIVDATDMSDKTMRQLARASQPALIETKVDWAPLVNMLGGSSLSSSGSTSSSAAAATESKGDSKKSSSSVRVVQWPEVPHNVFYGCRTFMYATITGVEPEQFAALCERTKSGNENKSPVTISVVSTSSLLGNAQVVSRFALTENSVVVGPSVGGGANTATLHALAACRRIEELTVQHHYASNAEVATTKSAIEAEIVCLSVAYGLLSKFASFVAVREDARVDNKQSSSIEVPLALTTGGRQGPQGARGPIGAAGASGARGVACAAAMPMMAMAACSPSLHSWSHAWADEDDACIEEACEEACEDSDGDSDMESVQQQQTKGLAKSKGGRCSSSSSSTKSRSVSESKSMTAKAKKFPQGDELLKAMTKLADFQGRWSLSKGLKDLVDTKSVVLGKSVTVGAGADPVEVAIASLEAWSKARLTSMGSAAPSAVTLDMDLVLGTCLALAVLVSTFAAKAAEWKMLKTKAVCWFNKEAAKDKSGFAKDMIAQARIAFGVEA